MIAVLLKVGAGASLICTCYVVQAQTKQNIHRNYASVIVWNLKTMAPLKQTRLDKAHVHRRVCKLMMYVQ